MDHLIDYNSYNQKVICRCHYIFLTFSERKIFGGRSSARGGAPRGKGALTQFRIPPVPRSRTHEVTVLQLQSSEYRRVTGLIPHSTNPPYIGISTTLVVTFIPS